MSALLQEMSARAQKLNIPLSVQLDLTYRCNERCVHCYLDHDDHGEMTTAEIKHLLDEMADAGVFILTLSGGEIFLRKDFFEILEHARRLMFCVKLKTNAVLIREREADPPPRSQRRVDSGQHLLAPSRSSRRDHADPRITQALPRCDPLSEISGSEGHHRQCSDDPEHAGLSRRSRPRQRTGRRMHSRSHGYAHDGRQPLDGWPRRRPQRAAPGLP